MMANIILLLVIVVVCAMAGFLIMNNLPITDCYNPTASALADCQKNLQFHGLEGALFGAVIGLLIGYYFAQSAD